MRSFVESEALFKMMRRATQITVIVLCSGCKGAPDEIAYRGEKIRLTRSYPDYDTYKNDPDNIHASEVERVQRMVMNASIDSVFESRIIAAKAVGEIVFPGYGGGGFTEERQSDGTLLTGFSAEIPRAEKTRYFVFQVKDSVYYLIDDFVHTDSAGWISAVSRAGDRLVFRSMRGNDVLSRPLRPGFR